MGRLVPSDVKSDGKGPKSDGCRTGLGESEVKDVENRSQEIVPEIKAKVREYFLGTDLWIFSSEKREF